jgi:hypothetical protein
MFGFSSIASAPFAATGTDNKIVDVQVDEAIDVLEQYVGLIAANEEVNESVGFTDDFSPQVDFVVLVEDVVTAEDEVNSQVDFSIIVAEMAGFLDTIIGIKQWEPPDTPQNSLWQNNNSQQASSWTTITNPQNNTWTNITDV